MRLNLSLPDEIDHELDRVSRATGRSKASFAVEAITAQLPRWRRLVRELSDDSHAHNGEPQSQVGGEIAIAAGAKPQRDQFSTKEEYFAAKRLWEKARG